MIFEKRFLKTETLMTVVVNDFSSIFRFVSWTYIEPGSGGPITRSLRAERGSSRSNYGGKVLTFGCFSNPVYSYVNFCNLERDGVSGDTGHGI